MDNFEKHVRDNREMFNVHKADKATMWAKIETELEQPKQKVIPLWKSPMIRIAASILIVLGVTAFISLFVLRQGNIEEGTFASKELQDIDMHYNYLVMEQVTLVKNHPDLSPTDREEFLSFMEDLDIEYVQLKLEMRKNLDNELVLEAIVGNYKKRIELIENLLRQINESKKIIDDENGYTL